MRCSAARIIGRLAFLALVATALAFKATSDIALAEDRVFAEDSPWNSPIPSDAPLDERSDSIKGYLAASEQVVDLYEFGVPVWEADGATDRYRVKCTKRWGRCPFAGLRVPIPDDASASRGSDGAMVVIDRTRGRAYEFWQARRKRGRWVASWGDVSPLDGDGRNIEATGSGISRLAGVVRLHEIERGQIDHALVFSTENACRDRFRYPANQTDGHSDRSDCIPHGTRIRLDPSVSIETIPGITPGERAMAEALQTYGAYAIDQGGAGMAFIFEAPNGRSNPYPAAGFEFDYFQPEHIPWDRLQVLAGPSGDEAKDVGR